MFAPLFSSFRVSRFCTSSSVIQWCFWNKLRLSPRLLLLLSYRGWMGGVRSPLDGDVAEGEGEGRITSPRSFPSSDGGGCCSIMKRERPSQRGKKLLLPSGSQDFFGCGPLSPSTLTELRYASSDQRPCSVPSAFLPLSVGASLFFFFLLSLFVAVGPPWLVKLFAGAEPKDGS